MIIAFSGYKSSGKSTAANALVETGFVDVKMADPLKKMLQQLFRYAGCEDAYVHRCLEGDLKEQPEKKVLLGATPRHAMQQLGTEWRNSINEHLWSNLWRKKVSELLGNGFSVVCSDIRFPHEIELLRTFGTDAYLIHIDRGIISQNSHASEQDISSFADFTISNTGSVEELIDAVYGIYLEIAVNT